MTQKDIALPHGYRLVFHRELDSTNSEAVRLIANGAPDRLWIWALTQNAGRGRHRRHWQSLKGNLFASLVLRPDCEPKTAAELGFVGGLAVYETVTELASGGVPDPTLKWPNDLLLGGKKAGGILLESTTDPHGKLAVVIGVGLNLAAHPKDTDYPATDLASHGVTASPAAALEHLTRSCVQWLSRWDSGAGFAAIREAWLARAMPLGTPLEIRLADERRRGSYQGIDEAGALILAESDGTQRRITTGDVFPL